ncbi:MAG: thiamine-phosphate kinase [Dehalococcoidia bacterium]|nr:MAG: thiamine-phosphate kinase [Dehalococcoidia bacterium]
MDVSELGEFGLIERLRAALPAPSGRVAIGVGDDAAVWAADEGFALATTDTVVAGVHFLPDAVAWRDVGWKSLAVNVSDIAAMGGTPSVALVTLCLPPATSVDAVDELYAGIADCARAHEIDVAGGDIVSAPVLTITVALYGTAGRRDDGTPRVLRRDAASVGDPIAVTGPLGGSAGGLRALREQASGDAATALVARQMRPRPRIDAGRAALDAGVRCAIDISDGLVQDLGHVCEASGVGATVELARLPLDAALVELYPIDARMLAATGGEDYELILVAPEDVLAATGAALGAQLAIIGRITEDRGVRLLDEDGHEIDVAAGGWDHLKPSGPA